jgi:hypothetical protein
MGWQSTETRIQDSLYSGTVASLLAFTSATLPIVL